jgi:hypothetical protein
MPICRILGTGYLGCLQSDPGIVVELLEKIVLTLNLLRNKFVQGEGEVSYELVLFRRWNVCSAIVSESSKHGMEKSHGDI